MLHDVGVLRDMSVLDCPCNGPCPHIKQELASFEQVDHIRKTDPDQYGRMLRWDYAYNVGYVPAAGRPVPHDLRRSASMPVLADSPDHIDFETICDGNSPNHGRRGQNVLYRGQQRSLAAYPPLRPERCGHLSQQRAEAVPGRSL